MIIVHLDCLIADTILLSINASIYACDVFGSFYLLNEFLRVCPCSWQEAPFPFPFGPEN